MSVGVVGSKAQTVVFLTGSGSPIEREGYGEDVETFQRLNPGIKVRIEWAPWPQLPEKFLLAARAGNPPDVERGISTPILRSYARMGLIEPLDKYFSAEERGHFYKRALDPYVVGGTLYAVPRTINLYSLVVDQTKLRRAGIDPNSIRDWDHLLKIAEKLTVDKDGDGVIDQFGFSYMRSTGRYVHRLLTLLCHVNGTSLSRLKEDKKEVTEALDFIYKSRKYVPKGQLGYTSERMLYEAWSLDKVAMTIPGGIHLYSNLYRVSKNLTTPDRLWPVLTPPGPSSRTREPGLLQAGQGVCVASGSKNKEAAVKWLKYLASAEGSIGWLRFWDSPPRDDVDINLAIAKHAAGEDYRWWLERWCKWGKKGEPVALLPRPAEFESTLEAVFADLIQDKTTPEKAYDTLVATWNRLEKE
jgi:ABC-type glycerol-3-phosphate transport system substrate-binding protein